MFKKQKKSSVLKGYWYVLIGQELYCYKRKGETKHKELKSLSGVFIKDEKDQVNDDGTLLYAFLLIFPNKKRIYFCKTKEDKQAWLTTIKQVTEYNNFEEYYELGAVLGQGKYGVVRRGQHKRTKQDVAIKIIKKKDLPIKDLELLKREIEVLKVC